MCVVSQRSSVSECVEYCEVWMSSGDVVCVVGDSDSDTG